MRRGTTTYVLLCVTALAALQLGCPILEEFFGGFNLGDPGTLLTESPPPDGSPSPSPEATGSPDPMASPAPTASPEPTSSPQPGESPMPTPSPTPDPNVVCAINEPSGTDQDGDGLTDDAENAGWTVTVEDGFGDRSSREVTSDPLDPDSNDDGICDLDARSNFLDPRAQNGDTDGDGLSDSDELNEWGSSPIDVDTDNDSNGNPALFDGQEVNSQGTSPTLDDTDGDGITDGDEILELAAIFNPLIANVPIVEMDLVGATDLGVNIVITSSQQSVEGTNVSLEQGESSEYSTTNTTAHEISAELSLRVGQSVEAEASVPPAVKTTTSVEVTATAGYSYNTSDSVTQTSSQDSRETYSKALEESRTEGQELVDGSIGVGLQISNPSNVSYRLDNLVLTALQRDSQNRASFKTIASVTPEDFTAISLAPGDATGTLRASVDIPANVALELLAEPERLFFEVGNFDLFRSAPELRQDINFAFLEQETNAKTALVQIDYGNGNVLRNRVATNVARENGQIVGVTMKTVIDSILEIPFETQVQEVNGEPLSRALTSVHDFASGQDVVVNPDNNAFWAVVGAAGVVIPDEVDFEDVVIQGGDAIYVLYVIDADGDGLFAREEYLYRTFDSQAAADASNVADPKDSDGDGIEDGDEVKVGWMIGREGVALVPPYDENAQIFSDPSRIDVDRDGLTDPQERDAGTDPNNPDTDGDGFCDGTGSGGAFFNCPPGGDPDPLDPTITGNQPPEIGTVAQTVNGFNLTLTVPVSDANGLEDITEVFIDWGDGSDITLNSVPLSPIEEQHSYSDVGMFTVNIEVTDSFDRIDTDSIQVDIAASTADLLVEYLFSNNGDDTSGNDRHGSIEGGPCSNNCCAAFVTDRFGTALRCMAFNSSAFQGGSGCGLDSFGMLAGPHVPISESFTIVTWISPSNTNDHWIAGQSGNNPSSDAWARMILGDDALDPVGLNSKVSFHIPHSTTSITVTDPDPVVTTNDPAGNPTDNWYFFAATVASDGATTVAKLYRGERGDLPEDAVPVSEVASASQDIVYTNPSDTNPFYIASGESGADFRDFHGRIDDARVYGRALSLSELEVLFSISP
jgi:hypothetical protein